MLRRCKTAAFACALLLALAVAGSPGLVSAQDFPNRPIELVVPYGAGGGNDLTARALAAVAPEYLGQPLIIRIRPGAGSVLGLSEVLRAPHDGYTLAYPGPHSIVTRHFRDLPVSLVDDFVPVAQIVHWPMILLVAPDSPYQTLEDLLEAARSEPGAIAMGNGGSLSIAHLPALVLELLAGVEFTHVPFDGGGPLLQAVVTGSVEAVHGVPAWAVPAVQRGQVRALAVSAPERMPELPDVPTYRELGYDIAFGLPTGVVAPKGIPADRLAFLREAFAKLVQDPVFITMIERQGDRVAYADPETYWEFYREIDRQSAQVAQALRAAGVVQ